MRGHDTSSVTHLSEREQLGILEVARKSGLRSNLASPAAPRAMPFPGGAVDAAVARFGPFRYDFLVELSIRGLRRISGEVGGEIRFIGVVVEPKTLPQGHYREDVGDGWSTSPLGILFALDDSGHASDSSRHLAPISFSIHSPSGCCSAAAFVFDQGGTTAKECRRQDYRSRVLGRW